MRSSYKRIGLYVQLTNMRNGGLSVTNLQGVSINKHFMPSVANINGTDLSNYKVVSNGQFAFNPMHVGRDEVLPIAMLGTDDPVIVSPAYVVFEIIDKQELLPEYLMMWCRRPEFDRNAWFTTDSSIRGGFSWDDFCEMKLPVPLIEKQREIVKEYHTIVDRIKLNERLNQKLEETAQAIYKQWFIDFEFPIPVEYAVAIGKPELEGQPYKSSGGEMGYDKAAVKEIPCNWTHGSWNDLSTQFSGFAFEGEMYSFDKGLSVVRGENVSEQKLRWDTHKKLDSKIPKRAESCYLKEMDILIGMDGSKVGKNWALIGEYDLPLILAQRVACVRAKEPSWQIFLYHSMLSQRFYNYVSQVTTGTSVPHISGGQIMDFPSIIPPSRLIEKFGELLYPVFRKAHSTNAEIEALKKMQNILLSSIATV